jgi:hypothetical protein
LPDRDLVVIRVVGHDFDDGPTSVVCARGPQVIPWLHHLAIVRITDRRHRWNAAGFAKVIEGARDHGALGDEGDQAHAAAAAPSA